MPASELGVGVSWAAPSLCDPRHPADPLTGTWLQAASTTTTTTTHAPRQGSGWGWLAYAPELKKLVITTTLNQDPLAPTTGLVPLLGIDVSAQLQLGAWPPRQLAGTCPAGQPVAGLSASCRWACCRRGWCVRAVALRAQPGLVHALWVPSCQTRLDCLRSRWRRWQLCPSLCLC